uniref:Uncharacterized protein n=2 Tax=Meloidogyne enterolobii TaxID=390850 RepID=A0A6V7UQN6_MELEN|nr:unnamed protein product [Meloidogyne enterolobii]
MIIIRCWLEQLFKCSFDRVYFFKNLFNPQMINLLFDNNNKTIPLKFNIQKPALSTDNKIFKNVLNFCLNHLSVSEFIDIDFRSVNITEEHTNILFNILINEGNKFPKIYLMGFRLTTLYNYIEEYIQATFEDCSRMVPVIIFEFSDSPNFKLNERAEKIKIKPLNGVNFINYQITNIYNPKLRFSFCNEESIEDGSTGCILIRKIKSKI